MAAVLVDCKRALASILAGPFLPLLAPLLLPSSGTISGIVGSLQSGGALSGRNALTINCSQMSVCGRSHERQEKCSKKLWFKFQVLAPSRSENTDQKRYP